MKQQKRSFLAVMMAVSVALMGVGCSGDLPLSPETSASAPSAPSMPTTKEGWASMMHRITNGQRGPSQKAATPFRAPDLPGTALLPGRYNTPRVHAMTDGTLRIIIYVNNDDSGYAWPSANGVAHVLVDNSPNYVDQPDVYGSGAYVDIPLSAGSHTVVLVEDFYATHELLATNIGNVTISQGQLIEQGADFTDKPCHPSCP